MAMFGEQKIAVYIDGANLWFTSKQLRWMVDYAKVTSFLSKKGRVVIQNYYTAINPEMNTIRAMVDWLSYNGWNVVSKPAKVFQDNENGYLKIKGNMDVELCIDVFEASRFMDITDFYLFTGDGDFEPLVKYLRRLGKHVTVVSTIMTSPKMCADELRRASNTFIDLHSYREKLERRDAD